MARKSLTDILRAGDRDSLAAAWKSTEAAADKAPLPPGDYECIAETGELFTSRTSGTPGYKIAFQVIAGQFSGRLVWFDCWLTPAALPMSKRDLARIGIADLEQLERPLPDGLICKVKVLRRRDDDGAEYNRVDRFELLRIERPQPDPFAPDAVDPSGDGGDTSIEGGEA